MIVSNNVSKNAVTALASYKDSEKDLTLDRENAITEMLQICNISDETLKSIAIRNGNEKLAESVFNATEHDAKYANTYSNLAFSALIDVSYRNLIASDVSLKDACVELAALKHIFGFGNVVDFNGKTYNGFTNFLSDYFPGYSPKTLALYADIGQQIYIPIRGNKLNEEYSFLADYAPSVLKPLVNLKAEIKTAVFDALKDAVKENTKITARVIVNTVKDAKNGKLGLPSAEKVETVDKAKTAEKAEKLDKTASTPIASESDIYDASSKAVKQRVDKMLFAGYDDSVNMCSMSIDLVNKDAFINMLDNCIKNAELAKAFITAFKLKVEEGFKP